MAASPIFNFIETGQFPFRSRPALKPVFLSNRNFEPHYNVSSILRAFSLIQQQHPDAALIVVGDGSEADDLRAISVELGLKNVDFRGSVTPRDMPIVYDQADIYLNAPSVDNMPLSVLESFSAGLPVVSTNAGGIPYILEHERTGLLVEVNDHEALAAGALRLLDDNEFAQTLIVNAK